jgi:hypothetical protein
MEQKKEGTRFGLISSGKFLAFFSTKDKPTSAYLDKSRLYIIASLANNTSQIYALDGELAINFPS